MVRRVAFGWVVVVVLTTSGPRLANAGPPPQQEPNPVSGGPVGLSPIRSINDTINGRPGTAAAPSAAAIPIPGTNPTASGPAATSPGVPVGATPVSLQPLPGLNQSLDQGYSGGISSLFRRPRPRQAANVGRTNPSQAAPAYPTTDSIRPTLAPLTGNEPRPRPAPYAKQTPESGRPRIKAPSDPAFVPVAGRPTLGDESMSGQGRPRSTIDDGRTQEPRPVGPAVFASQAGPAKPEPVVIPTNPPPIPPVDPDPIPTPAPIPTPIPPAEVLPTVEPTPVPVPQPVSIPVPTPPIEPPVEAAAPPTIEPTPTPVPVLAEAPVEVPAGLPPLEVPPPPVALASAGSIKLEEVLPSASNQAPLSDPEVNQTSGDPTAMRLKEAKKNSLSYASRRVAIVGDEVITLHELTVIVLEQYRKNFGQEMPATSQQSAEDRMLVHKLSEQCLDGLIDQCVILREAKRKLKGEKGIKAFNETIDKKWKDDEIPPLLRQMACSNEFEVQKKLADQGKSLAEMKDQYRKRMMATEFLMHEIHGRITCDLVEQRAFYNEHIKDFEQPERLSWREIEVSLARYPDRATARKKAEAILARLAKKEDFATVAKAASDGPTASAGGLYADMHPGGYGIPAVNDALLKLPTGQVSPIIEAPTSFHIIRVESRRDAGPLRFDEVQARVREEVFRTNFIKAQVEYIAKLRSRTLVRTIYGPPEGNANTEIARKGGNDPAVQAASNR